MNANHGTSKIRRGNQFWSHRLMLTSVLIYVQPKGFSFFS